MNFRLRLYLLLFSFIVGGFLILARLFYWQVWSAGTLAATAEKQHQSSLEIPAERGIILASDGFPLANNQEAFLAFASLPEIDKSPKEIAGLIAPLIASTSAVADTGKIIEERLSSKDLRWIPIQHQLPRKTKQEIESLNLSGINFEEEELRNYPEASIAAQLLGFVGSDAQGRPKGYFGLEGYYDWQLKGTPGRLQQEKDAFGRPILVGNYNQEEPENGRDLQLFLDRAIQMNVERILKEGIERYGAKSGTATVMDPKTGGILAMASFPSYDPGEFSNFDTALYKNPMIADLFEPGSIIKPLIMAAAVNEKVVDPQTKCDKCDGPRIISGYTIRTFNDQYHPKTTMTEVLENSDNTGMIFVAEKLGIDRLLEYFESYGFGDKTGIDLEEEAGGNLKPLKDWREIDLACAAFGQGISLTRMQILRAFGAIANQGKLVKPLVVQNILEKDRRIGVKPEIIRQVFKPQTASTLTEMLISVTEKSPLHFPRDRIPELKKYRIAAKSGTAQIPVAGKYSEKTIGSVIGFAPADDPRFLVMVSLVEPTARPWGSDTAGPIFFQILEELFRLYSIPPSS